MKDARDLRDPSKFPDLRHLYREWGGAGTFHEFVDQLNLNIVPDYPKHESMATESVRAYQQEIKDRAEKGDIYAQSLINGYAWDEPGQ